MKTLPTRSRMFALAAWLALVPGALLAQVQTSQQAPPPAAPNVLTISAGRTPGQIVVPVDQSQLLNVDQTFREISVGNKDIADVIPLSQNLIYLLGKKRGTTNLTISNMAGDVIAVVDVVVTYDVNGLKSSLFQLVPSEKIDIRPAGDSVVLSGKVSSTDHLRQIVALAEHYAPGGITNMLSVGGSQQVSLEVKFAEVQRSALENLGVKALNGAYSNKFSPPATIDPGVPAGALGTGGIVFSDLRSYFLRATIEALEQKGLLRTLARPNLVSLSGDTASFLAGGQIPIPVVQAGAAGGVPLTTVQYKDFGVGLSFTPTVIATETINLDLKTEVSAIDTTISVVTSGISVPGFKVRRTNTTVELKDGESFAIAGLLQDDFHDAISQIPGLGNIPILGALLRSSDYQHNQTELVVLITVHLVAPGATRYATPLDTLVLPTPGELFGLGKTEGDPAVRQPGATGYVLP